MPKPNYWWLVISLMLLIGVAIWRPLFLWGMPNTHDGENHLARFANYYLALKEGQFPPRWAPNLMNRYGYPVFNYNYPLANILSVPLTVIDINLEDTFKTLTILTLAMGAVGVWLWLRNQHSSKTASGLAVITYWSTPYILSAVFFRGSIGEVMVYGLMPWLLWWLGKLRRWPGLSIVVLGGVLIGLLLLAHNVTGLLGLGTVLIYAILEWGRAKAIWKKAIISFMIGLGLSLWFWLPAVLESNQVVLFHAGIQKEFLNHLVTIRQLATSPLTFGFSTADPVDSLSLAAGAVGLFTLWASLILLVVSQIRRTKSVLVSQHIYSHPKGVRLILVSLFLTIGLLFLQSTYSKSIWLLIPFTQIIQFPWRLMLFVPSLILPVLVWIWDQAWWTTRVLILLGLGLQIWVGLNLQVVDRFHKTNLDYFAFAQSTSTQNENRPVTFTYDNIADWQPSPFVWDGNANINVIAWNGSNRKYLINAKTTVLMVEPTAKFLGWQTWAKNLESGKTFKVTYGSDDDLGGKINYLLPPGQYLITTRFTQQTPARYIGNSVFLLTLLVVCGVTLKKSTEAHDY